MKNYQYLVNPVDFFKEHNPEAFDLLPEGAADLRPEITLMIVMSKHQGLRHVHSYNIERCKVPLGICQFVFEKDWTQGEILRDIAMLSRDDYTRGEVAAA